MGLQLRPWDEANGHFQTPYLVLGQSLQRILRKIHGEVGSAHNTTITIWLNDGVY